MKTVSAKLYPTPQQEQSLLRFLRVGRWVYNRAKSISDAAWGQFVTTLTYKAVNAGATVVAVDPRGTTQECSECGQTVPKSLSDRVHACSCGLTLDRDVNAARNILRRATPGTHGERCLHEGRSLNREYIVEQSMNVIAKREGEGT